MHGPTTNLGLVGLAVINPVVQAPKREVGHGHVTILLQSTTGKLVQDLLQTQIRFHANFGNVQLMANGRLITCPVIGVHAQCLVEKERQLVSFPEAVPIQVLNMAAKTVLGDTLKQKPSPVTTGSVQWMAAGIRLRQPEIGVRVRLPVETVYKHARYHALAQIPNPNMEGNRVQDLPLKQKPRHVC